MEMLQIAGTVYNVAAITGKSVGHKIELQTIKIKMTNFPPHPMKMFLSYICLALLDFDSSVETKKIYISQSHLF